MNEVEVAEDFSGGGDAGFEFGAGGARVRGWEGHERGGEGGEGLAGSRDSAATAAGGDCGVRGHEVGVEVSMCGKLLVVWLMAVWYGCCSE